MDAGGCGAVQRRQRAGEQVDDRVPRQRKTRVLHDGERRFVDERDDRCPRRVAGDVVEDGASAGRYGVGGDGECGSRRDAAAAQSEAERYRAGELDLHGIVAAFDFQVAVHQVRVDAQTRFDQSDVLIAGSKEAFDASANTHARFHQVAGGYLQEGKNAGKNAGENEDRIYRSTAQRSPR